MKNTLGKLLGLCGGLLPLLLAGASDMGHISALTLALGLLGAAALLGLSYALTRPRKTVRRRAAHRTAAAQPPRAVVPLPTAAK
ncbi:MAG TPA: hypothetical protein H9832_05875 [Candidatus Agathobaculum merdavium]|nr:hypothetical protein [Candidatus Agathobaculum merdavium]